MDERYYIKINNDLYNDGNISNIELSVLILLYWDYQYHKSRTKCSVQMLADMMKINTGNNTTIIGQIRDAIKSLLDKGHITNIYNLDGGNEINNKHTLFYVELIEPPESGYFKLYEDDLNKIFTYLKDKNISKFDFIRYFVATQRVISNNDNFGYLPQSTIKGLISNSKTILRYNSILQNELQLIRYNSDYITPKYRYCSTFIGVYEDKELFNEKVQTQADNLGYMRTNKKISNSKRSLKQKINKSKDDYIKELEEKLEALQYRNNTKQKDQEIIQSYNEMELSKEYPIEKSLVDEEDNWGDTEDFDAEELDEFLGDKYNKFSSLVEKIKNRQLSLQNFFKKYYTTGSYQDFKDYQLQPF